MFLEVPRVQASTTAPNTEKSLQEAKTEVEKVEGPVKPCHVLSQPLILSLQRHHSLFLSAHFLISRSCARYSQDGEYQWKNRKPGEREREARH